MSGGENPGSGRGSALEVFRVFLGLGLTSFGGPVAHLGCFREAFVVRRGWLGDRAYADLVALCQFLPGPASSQVGMAIGAQRALLGVNAAVVGLLAAALYDPVFTAGVTSTAAMAVTAAAFVALAAWKAPAWAVVIGAGLLGFVVL